MRVAFWQASRLSCSVALRTMAAKQGKGYQTLILELLEKAAWRATWCGEFPADMSELMAEMEKVLDPL
jgi:hypothetical protein